jgi:hypothetical protein
MPAIGEIYQVTFQSSIQGQTIENVCHFREVTGVSTDAQIDTAAQGFFTLLSNLLPSTQILTGIIVKKMTPVAFDERLLVPTTATGQQSASPLNQTIALVFTKRTGVAGKTHRGRLYSSAIPSNMTNDGCRLNTTGGTICGTFASSVIGQYGPSGSNGHLQFGVYSKAIGGGSPFTAAGWQPVITLDTQIIFGNQRRRRVGVGI